MNVRTFPIAGAILSLLLAVPSDAHAGDDVTAEALFVEAREAMRQGDFARACSMLEESYRLDPGIGTGFNLGECYERLGKTASAWASFRDAAAASKLAGQIDREAVAKERAKKLEDRLCRVTIQVAAQQDVTVKRDGDVIGAGQWGIALPIDPGAHTVEAIAPRRRPWSLTFSTALCPSSMSVGVPVLEPLSSPEPRDEEPKIGPVRSSTKRTIVTVASLGLGAAGVGLGSYFGVRAWSLRDQSNDGHCVGNRCDDVGSALRADSRAAGTGATIAFTSAAVLLTVGVVLWLTDAR